MLNLVKLVIQSRKKLGVALINQITVSNNNTLIEQKINFFADYYQFAVSNIGQSDYIEVENYLSLIEKILFQIDTNLDNCPKYIDSYLLHPLFQKENKYFKDYTNYTTVSNLFEEYKVKGKSDKKKGWIQESEIFAPSLKKFKTELKRGMFKKSIKEIISFLTCDHSISEHQDDLIHNTNIIVSEFLLNKRAKKDVAKTFSKILSRDIETFPFQETFLKKNKERLVKAKTEYLENITFEQQFNGIYYFLKEKPKKLYFIYRVYGITAEESFHFKYNRVTFSHPKHKKFNALYDSVKKEKFPIKQEFLSCKDLILAFVKVNYFSREIAEKEALYTISKELKFLDLLCKTNGRLEKSSYLTTSQFKKFGGLDRGDVRRIFTNNETTLKRNNPFAFLKGANERCKSHFLKHEHIYINGTSPENYWQYIESLLPKETTKDKIDIIASLLTLNATSNENRIIEAYIKHCISPFNTPHESLNILGEKQMEYYNQRKQDFKQLSNEIDHPFLNIMFAKRLDCTISYGYRKEYYKRILWECYAQRNSIIHSGSANEKALILLDSTIPKLIQRFRVVLFDGMQKYKECNFEELIENLKAEADEL